MKLHYRETVDYDTGFSTFSNDNTQYHCSNTNEILPNISDSAAPMIDLPADVRLVPRMEEEDRSHLNWPAGRAFPIEPLPPYPAGPILTNVKYPRDLSSPKYICPHCEEQFHFHRLHGVVLCPFCHNIVSVGHYNRRRCWSHLITALVLCLAAAAVLAVYLIEFPNQTYLVVSVCFLLLAGLFCVLRAAHLRHSLETAPRVIEDY